MALFQIEFCGVKNTLDFKIFMSFSVSSKSSNCIIFWEVKNCVPCAFLKNERNRHAENCIYSARHTGAIFHANQFLCFVYILSETRSVQIYSQFSFLATKSEFKEREKLFRPFIYQLYLLTVGQKIKKSPGQKKTREIK